MSEVTFNSQSLTTEASNYTGSVDKLKQAVKSHTDSSGIINITRETTAEDAKKIENYTSQVNALFAGTKTEDIQQALWANPILGNKLANLLGCKPHELPTVLSDLNKSVTNLPSILGSLLVSSEDKQFQKLVNTGLSAAEPFMKAVTDSDMRELLKLLIAVFAQMLTTQRQNDLLNLNNLMSSFEAKIKDMEASRDKQYSAAITSAVTGIVMGFISLWLTVAGTAMQMRSATNTMKGNISKERNNTTWSDKVDNKLATEAEYQRHFQKLADVTGQPQFILGGAMTSGGQAASQMAQGIAGVVSAMQQKDAKDADIKAEAEAMVMEVIRKAQEQNQSTAKAIMDFINNLLSMIQQLNQNARQTEMQIAA
ncbi:MAG: hypothetical protein IJ793_04045 [Opitutales bacterium]|nr:hypothetical protein [Opitutales bacterium]